MNARDKRKDAEKKRKNATKQHQPVAIISNQKLVDRTGLPQIVYQDAERIIVSFNHLSRPPSRQAAKAKTCPPYFRVWIESTLDYLLRPVVGETAADIAVTKALLSPLFEQGLGVELEYGDSRVVQIRINCDNYPTPPNWFQSLLKRGVPLYFEQCRLNGQSVWPITRMGTSFTMRTMAGIPAELAELMFPFHAKTTVFTAKECTMENLLLFVTGLWDKKIPGQVEPLSVGVERWLRAPSVKEPRVMVELLDYIAVAISNAREYERDEVRKSLSQCNVTLLHKAKEICECLAIFAGEDSEENINGLIPLLQEAILRGDVKHFVSNYPLQVTKL